jgi:hypothetical protein
MVRPPMPAFVRGKVLIVAVVLFAAGFAFPVARVGTAIVSAPGYKPVQVSIELKMDDCDNQLTQQFEVVLMPDTGADPSVTKVGQALGCS